MVGADVGRYYQVSNDYHAYIDVMHKVGVPDPMPDDPYKRGEVWSLPLINDRNTWNAELAAFIEEPIQLFLEPFFSDVARPMVQAWCCYKEKDYRSAMNYCDRILSPDWKRAGHEWIVRRFEKATKGRVSATVAHDEDHIRPKRS